MSEVGDDADDGGNDGADAGDSHHGNDDDDNQDDDHKDDDDDAPDDDSDDDSHCDDNDDNKHADEDDDSHDDNIGKKATAHGASSSHLLSRHYPSQTCPDLQHHRPKSISAFCPSAALLQEFTDYVHVGICWGLVPESR